LTAASIGVPHPAVAADDVPPVPPAISPAVGDDAGEVEKAADPERATESEENPTADEPNAGEEADATETETESETDASSEDATKSGDSPEEAMNGTATAPPTEGTSAPPSVVLVLGVPAVLLSFLGVLMWMLLAVRVGN